LELGWLDGPASKGDTGRALLWLGLIEGDLDGDKIMQPGQIRFTDSKIASSASR